MRKLEERAILKASSSGDSKNLKDDISKAKKSKDKKEPAAKEEGPDTDEESQKPIKDGDVSKSSFGPKSAGDSFRSDVISHIAPSPPLFDR